MKKCLFTSQQGSVAVMVAILLPVILGLTGLAIDIGNLVLTKTRFRNAVDAAIHAGAQAASAGKSASDVSVEVTKYLNKNKFYDIPVITDAKDTIRNPKLYDELNITVSHSVSTDFMGVFGDSLKSVTLTVTAEIIYPKVLQPPFTYLLFSDQDLTMNGHNHANGSVHANGNLDVNGSEVIGGNIEGVKGVTLHGTESISGYVQADVKDHIRITGHPTYSGPAGGEGGAVYVAMPDFSAEIISNTKAADKYTTSKTFNGLNVSGGTTVSGGTIYVQGDVTINGKINWTGSILATGNIDIGGDNNVSGGQLQGSNQLFLYSKSGNITVHGNCQVGSSTANVIGYAPNGSITVSGNNTWYGRLVAKTLTLNGNGDFNGQNVEPNRSVPYGVATITKPQIIM